MYFKAGWYLMYNKSLVEWITDEDRRQYLLRRICKEFRWNYRRRGCM
jgi:hypothetical protein